MPHVKVVFFQAEDKTVPFLEWFDSLSIKAQDKCFVKLERLAELGHELRRPEADYLSDDIYELGIGLNGINYRILYFFSGQTVAVLSHGIIKERLVPPKEINLAVKRKQMFEKDTNKHTYEEE